MHIPASRPDRNVTSLIAQVSSISDLPLGRATTLPPAVYRDPDFWQFEKRALLGEWFAVAHISQLSGPDSYIPVDLLDIPLIVSCDRDGKYHVLSALCPHRGLNMMNAEVNPTRGGCAARITCPYHSWAFDLSGRLRSAPLMEEAEDFRREDWPLYPYRSTVWNGFVFVNIDGRAEPLEDFYATLDTHVAPWDIGNMEVAFQREWDGAFNWKIMVDNWSECYHHIGTHKKTLQPTQPAKDVRVDLKEEAAFNRTVVPTNPNVDRLSPGKKRGGEWLRQLPAIAGLPLDNMNDSLLYVAYPGMLFATNRDSVVWIRLTPVDVDRTRVQTCLLLPRTTRDTEGYEQKLDTIVKRFVDFHMEDMDVNTAMQQSLRATEMLPPGRLGHLEAPLWMFQRYLAKLYNRHLPDAARQDTFVPAA